MFLSVLLAASFPALPAGAAPHPARKPAKKATRIIARHNTAKSVKINQPAAKPVAAKPAAPENAEPTIVRMGVMRAFSHNVIKQNCETWIDPEKGFVDQCSEVEQIVEIDKEPASNDSNLEVVEFVPPSDVSPESVMTEGTAALQPVEFDSFPSLLSPEFLQQEPIRSVTEPDAAKQPAPETAAIPDASSPVGAAVDTLQDLLARLQTELTAMTSSRQQPPKPTEETPQVVALTPPDKAYNLQAIALQLPETKPAPVISKPAAPAALPEKEAAPMMKAGPAKPNKQAASPEKEKIAVLPQTTTSPAPAAKSQTVQNTTAWPANPLSTVLKYTLGPILNFFNGSRI